MKLFIFIGILTFSSASFAGARRIYCEGNIVKMDEWAIDPVPGPLSRCSSA